MPTLTLYFGPEFADENWRDIAYQLESPGGHKRGGEWILGRAPDSDLTISVRNVSRRHASIGYSYAADRWSLQDLASQAGTFLNGRKLAPGDLHPLKIGDKFYLADNLVNVVEDEQDTIGNDGPPTIADTQPIVSWPPAPAPAPRTWQDSAHLLAQWLITGQTVPGKIYRLIVVFLIVGFSVIMIDFLSQ